MTGSPVFSIHMTYLRIPTNPNYHMSNKKSQAILNCFIDLKSSIWFKLGSENETIFCDTQNFFQLPSPLSFFLFSLSPFPFPFPDLISRKDRRNSAIRVDCHLRRRMKTVKRQHLAYKRIQALKPQDKNLVYWHRWISPQNFKKKKKNLWKQYNMKTECSCLEESPQTMCLAELSLLSKPTKHPCHTMLTSCSNKPFRKKRTTLK